MSSPPNHNRASNRLAAQSSPYLKQHAHNPVDWYPWGDEAFEKARLEDKPIFLSVGYSACHWCHVMERESFENVEIAELLNRFYVSIKVDREERPDIDQIYMSAVQLITRRGGWPMSVFLTPDGRPFYGGTYWPPQARMGMPGFRDILLKLHEYWTTKRDEVDGSADQLVNAIQNLAAPVFDRVPLDDETLRRGMRALLRNADRVHGGFGGAPKFPHPMDLRMLLRNWKRFEDTDALDVSLLTLRKMAHGGLFDHLGGGFHRYSTDGIWLVPHFEKMLYDNALLARAYLEAFQCTGDQFFAKVTRETLDYVLREMTDPEGGFYSTQDADSEGEEGRFFTWTDDDTRSLLGAEDAVKFNFCYDVTHRGNWEGVNILNLPRSIEDSARQLQMNPVDLEQFLSQCRKKLFNARQRRIPPERDEKILTSWNGLMIAAMAQAALVLEEPKYALAATKSAEFLLEKLRDGQGHLLHSFKDGIARIPGFLDDYACLIAGLVELFQTTADDHFLQAALDLGEDVIERYRDPEDGGFFYTANDQEPLIARTKDVQDNAVPSGNGMLATALLKLARLTSRDDLEEVGSGILKSMGSLLADHPQASSQALIGLDFLLGPTFEMVLVKHSDGLDADELCKAVWSRFLPNKVFVNWPAHQAPSIPLPILEDRLDSSASTLYICENSSCLNPVTTAQEAGTVLATL
jgi:uncharacterized protein YyaL (SSP411 family)